MLNFKAGQTAQLASSYSDAVKYLKVALALRESMEGGAWEGERRQTTMMIYLATITAYYWNFEVSGEAGLGNSLSNGNSVLCTNPFSRCCAFRAGMVCLRCVGLKNRSGKAGGYCT